MTRRGSPESQNIGAIFDWGSWGEKLALVMYRNFVIKLGRMCQILPNYSGSGKEHLLHIEMPDIFDQIIFKKIILEG